MSLITNDYPYQEPRPYSIERDIDYSKTSRYDASVEWTSLLALSDALADWRRVSARSYGLGKLRPWMNEPTAQRMRHDEILRGDD